MTMIQIAIPGVGKREIRRFRDSDGFENWDSYLENELIPFFFANVPECFQIRCSISGWLVGSYNPAEVEATIRQGAIATNMRRFSPWIDSFTTAELIDAIETLVDHVTTRMLILSRPSPIFTGAIGKQAVDSAPRTRQLIVLLNMLVFDNGGFRSRDADSFEIVDRLRKAGKLADLIQSQWDGSLESDSENANAFQDLYSGLVELDAKWQIRRLHLTEKEKAALESIRSASRFDVNRVRHVVWQMVILRDKTAELELSETWTIKAYREIALSGYNSANRTAAAKSNLVKSEKPKGEAKSTVVKPSKSKNPNVAMFADIFASFGGIK